MRIEGSLISRSNPLLVVTDGTVVMTMEQQKETDTQILCQRRWCDISVMFDSKFVVCLIKVRWLFYVKGMEEFGYYVTVTTKRESEMGEKRKRPSGHENVVGQQERWDNIDRGIIKWLKNRCMKLSTHSSLINITAKTRTSGPDHQTVQRTAWRQQLLILCFVLNNTIALLEN